MSRKRTGVSAAGWFYTQPGFRQPEAPPPPPLCAKCGLTKGSLMHGTPDPWLEGAEDAHPYEPAEPPRG